MTGLYSNAGFMKLWHNPRLIISLLFLPHHDLVIDGITQDNEAVGQNVVHSGHPATPE